jgi:hypothetical protein
MFGGLSDRARTFVLVLLAGGLSLFVRRLATHSITGSSPRVVCPCSALGVQLFGLCYRIANPSSILLMIRSAH